MADLDDFSEANIAKLPGMVNWYSPGLLAQTGGRHVLSGIFGQFADQRILQATIDGFSKPALTEVAKRYDYSRHPSFATGGPVWVDYIADLGDGFDSTFAMASLIAADEIDVAGAGRLPGGKLVILGGDEVYPYPSRKAYRERFEIPYRLALPAAPDGNPRRLMFALPGNHDWYDGLSSFDYTFCKARFDLDAVNHIGGWQCPQHRSYFAIRLPSDWWIWGADIQRSQYLDAGQIRYFRRVAEQMRAEGGIEQPKIILCIAEPSWSYDNRQEIEGQGNLDIIAEIAVESGARICAVLAGDTHHYSRYLAPEIGLNFVTAGGGGAYLSPTNNVKSSRTLNFIDKTYDLQLRHRIVQGRHTREPACWPSRKESRWLSLGVLAFPFSNYAFSVGLAVYYWLMTWLYSVTKVELRKNETHTVADWLIDMPLTPPVSIAETWGLTLLSGAAEPMLGLLTLALWALLYLYAESSRAWVRVLMATSHTLAHIIMMVVLYLLLRPLTDAILDQVVHLTSHLPSWRLEKGSNWYKIAQNFTYPFLMFFIGAVGAGLVWGAYLCIACFFNRHCDQAFSTMRLQGYKNFLRLKIEQDKLTIYPIGLQRIPSRRMWRKAKPDADGLPKGPAFVPSSALKPEIIDGPIEIRVGDIPWRDLKTRRRMFQPKAPVLS